MRIDERLTRDRPARDSRAERNRLHGLYSGHRRPPTAAARRRRRARHRRPHRPVVQHAARAPCVGGGRPLRHDHPELFCGDLFTRYGEYEASCSDDIVGPAVEAEDDAPGSLSLHPSSGTTIQRLAALDIKTLALTHGPAFTGDCRSALLHRADDFDRRITPSPDTDHGQRTHTTRRSPEGLDPPPSLNSGPVAAALATDPQALIRSQTSRTDQETGRHLAAERRH